MKDMLKKAMGKEDEGMGDMKAQAKMKALKELREMAMGMMGDDVKSGMMKKVTVAAPDKSGLEKGLEMAKEVVDKGPEGMAEEAEEMDEMGEEEEMEDEESPEALKAKIAELQAKLAGKA